MNKLLYNEIQKIHSGQITCPAAILMAIRSRIEKKQGVVDAIGAAFEKGNKGVLLVGKAGCGKTTILKSIFDGLGIGGKNKSGKTIGHWLSSVGASTGVGIFEIFELFSDNVIFADELSLDTTTHLHIIKQIANGEIMKPKHKDIEPTPFTGLLISATNAVRIPRGVGAMEHLLAVLDRFIIVKMDQPTIDVRKVMKRVFDGGKSNIIDWSIIKSALANGNTNSLTEEEKEEAVKLAEQKWLEVLDSKRPFDRVGNAIRDIFLFVKRTFDVKDLTKDQEAMELIRSMIEDCLITNPVNILWLDPIQEAIYDTGVKNTDFSIKDIMDEIEKSGMTVSRQYVHRVINKMIEMQILRRASRGKYSCKREDNSIVDNELEQSEESENPVAELL